MDVKRRDVLKGGAAVAATAAVTSAAIVTATPSYADQLDAAKKWVDSEFQPSTLTKEQQMAEMEWFIKASAPFNRVIQRILPVTALMASARSSRKFSRACGIDSPALRIIERTRLRTAASWRALARTRQRSSLRVTSRT